MANNPFEATWVILEGVDDHLGKFLSEKNAFLEGTEYTKLVHIDPQTRNHLHKVRLSRGIPLRLNRIALDVITNARDALDNAVFASVVASGVSITNERQIKFPFGNTLQE